MSKPKKKRVAIYARVSTKDKDQNPETQLMPLKRYVEDRDWTVFDVYVDEHSGREGKRGKDTAWQRLMDDAFKRKFDVVLVSRYNRFARSVKQLILALDDFENLGIDFISYHENIDTTTSHGRFFFTVVAGFAQLESDMISENVKDGLERARAQGKTLGRPKKSDEVNQAIIANWQETKSMKRTAKELKVGYGTVHRTVTAYKALSEAS